jgi:hypothetical protein
MAKRPTWVNESLDVLQFHEQLQKNLGSTASGRPSGSKDGWSIRNTAEALKISLGKCHSLLIVGKALKKNPTLSHASSFTAAVKLAKREQ